MQLRFFTTCLAAIITASTGVSQEPLGRFLDEKVTDPNAPAPAWDIQLLNPDGTPATDAKVVAVLLAPGGVVDQDLTPRPVPKADKQPLLELVNENGTVTVLSNDTKAIIASNKQGFLFLPASAFGDKAKLREWAHVELDVSTVPDDMRADIALNVTWTNSLQGMYVRPQMMQGNDPFLDAFDRPEKMVPKLDWRFDPMITWTHSVPVTNQSVRVPPGEIQVSLVSMRLNDEAQLLSEPPPGSCATTVGLWQTPGGTVRKIALPEFGTVEGMIKKDTSSTLPDWSNSGSEMIKFSLNCGLTADRPQILNPSESNDEYFSKLASDEGFKARRDTATGAMATTSDGRFRFPLVPVNTYGIHKLIETRKLPGLIPGQLAIVTVPLKPDGDNPSIVVNAKNTTVVNVTELPQPAPVIRIFSEMPGSASPSPLPAGAEIAYREVRRVIDGKEVKQVVPYVVNPNQSSSRRHGMSPFERPKNGDDGFAKEPDPFFAPDDAPRLSPKTETATTLIQGWLRSAKDPADQTELRKLLQNHLQQEFDANQKTRQAEIERLQQLLVKSKEWLDQRQQRRDEIIKKRIDDLLQQQALPKAEASGGR